MDKSSTPPGRIGDKWHNVLFDPVVHLWRHDKSYFSIFAVANLVLGQLGLLFAGMFFLQNGTAFGPFWDETISSGALYTFAIAFIASVLATIAFEFVDGQRKSKGMELWQHKLGWGLFACLLVIIQGGMVGSLLSTPRDSAPLTQVQEAPAHFPSAPSAELQKVSEPASALKVALGKSVSANFSTLRSGPWLQVLLWILSMAVATQIFCLTRLPFIRENYAQERTETVNEMAHIADGKTQTSFGERL